MGSEGGSSGSKRPSEDSVTTGKKPWGRDKTKRMAKCGSSGNSSMDAMSEGWVNFNESYPQFIELENRKLDLAQQRSNVGPWRRSRTCGWHLRRTTPT